MTDIEALLYANEKIIGERVEAEYEMEDGEFKRGHINGLKEARNRVEEVILELAGEKTLGEEYLEENSTADEL